MLGVWLMDKLLILVFDDNNNNNNNNNNMVIKITNIVFTYVINSRTSLPMFPDQFKG